MTELESVERDIALLRARVRYSRLAIADPNITPEAIDREHAGLDLFGRRLCALLTLRDDLRFLAED
ncbi:MULTISPECIES: hypothetical protein [Methylobacterium]|uniref:hypothetical protein n=1 Tax=Methylobacterium TaxID=407 RepID=UPI00197BB710|nr:MULTISPECIES: hypothetical protein [Methylobacterium]MBN4098594.1 hypothetical protein [Methylobacterium sp. OT2]UIN38477.1 hypothetical protein LXM90_31755 [Methylobacterium oryzae]